MAGSDPSPNCEASFHRFMLQIDEFQLFEIHSRLHFRCTPGHFCVSGSSKQEACPAGTFQKEFGKSSCDDCPERYFCNANILNDTICAHGVQLPSPCPQGFFCPPKMKTGTENGCPQGKA